MADQKCSGEIDFQDLLDMVEEETERSLRLGPVQISQKMYTKPAIADQGGPGTMDAAEVERCTMPNLLVIVEGETDQIILQPFLGTQLKGKYSLLFVIMRGDVTTKTNETKILSLLKDKIKEDIKRYSHVEQNIVRKGNVYCILHVIDTDGVWIPDDHVVVDAEMDSSRRTEYRERLIAVNSEDQQEGIRNRNKRKKRNVNKLCSTKFFTLPGNQPGGSKKKKSKKTGQGKEKKHDNKAPYRMIYMSCNIDHFIHDNANMTASEKEDSAKGVSRAATDLNSWERLPAMTKEESEAKKEYPTESQKERRYRASWKYISKGLHSLERHTNIHVVIDLLDELQKASTTETKTS